MTANVGRRVKNAAIDAAEIAMAAFTATLITTFVKKWDKSKLLFY